MLLNHETTVVGTSVASWRFDIKTESNSGTVIFIFYSLISASDFLRVPPAVDFKAGLRHTKPSAPPAHKQTDQIGEIRSNAETANCSGSLYAQPHPEVPNLT